jgi:hypothetical protein
MSRPTTNGAVKSLAGAVALAAFLAGCSSDMYYDRRETIAATGGNAVAANMVEQMADPWPRNSNNKNIPINGERMQRAIECYRKDKVTPPVDIDPTVATDTGPVQLSTGTACVGVMSSGSYAPVVGSSIGPTYSNAVSTAAK